MKTLHFYLTRQVVASLVMTVVVFTFVLLLGNILKEILSLLVSRQATLGIAVEAVGLLIPFVLAFALPMGMLTATLLTFGRFSADQELTAARAGGVSLLSLVTPILLLSLVLCGVSAYINMEIAPRCRVAYKELFFRVGANLITARLPERTYIKDFAGCIIHVGQNRQNQLKDVLIYVLEDKTNVAHIFRAPKGAMRVDQTNQTVIVDLFDVTGVLALEDGKQMFTHAGRMSVTNKLEGLAKELGKPRITDLTFIQLRDELSDLESRLSAPKSGRTNSVAELRELEKQRSQLTLPLRVQMHRQVAFSFACFGFTLIGIPLGIRVHRRETNISFAIALGLVLVYYGFLLVAQALATRPEWSPHLIVWIPNFLFQGIGAVLLWRANRGL
ncbi:MAG: YjgP/YjgQ family permease [Pedosphaera sp.]|nr:YjgP/YjgQ family permease [Pedosphaera sp.]